MHCLPNVLPTTLQLLLDAGPYKPRVQDDVYVQAPGSRTSSGWVPVITLMISVVVRYTADVQYIFLEK